MNVKLSAVYVFAIAMTICSAGVFSSTVNFAIRSGSAAHILSGHSFEIEIHGTFDKRLTSASYKISVTAQEGLINTIVHRSVTPELAYVVSDIATPNPFDPQFGLPYTLSASTAVYPITEVLLGLTKAFRPGDSNDGIPASSDVLLETLTIKPVGNGLLVISISEPSGSTTETDPNGSLFDMPGIVSGQSTVSFSVAMDADSDDDGDIDMVDFAQLQLCLGNDVISDPNCSIVDFDNDGTVGPADTELFINCSSGPQILARPGCRGEFE